MLTALFTHPISKTQFWEGQLEVLADVQDEHVDIKHVILQDRFGQKIDITHNLEAHGYCRQDIVSMALNAAENWAVFGVDHSMEQA